MLEVHGGLLAWTVLTFVLLLESDTKLLRNVSAISIIILSSFPEVFFFSLVFLVSSVECHSGRYVSITPKSNKVSVKSFWGLCQYFEKHNRPRELFN